MNKPSSSISKVCSSCGLLKPLSAFLYFTADSAEYGNICADCRKAGLGEEVLDKESETRTTTGAIIDSKSKVQGDTEKKNEFERTEEQYHEERDENEKLEQSELEKQQTIVKQEIKHRQGYLDKPRFLSQKQSDHNPSKWAQQKATEQASSIEQTEQQKETALEEQKKTEIDLTAPVEDTRIAGKIKHSGDAFKRFTTLVKSGSPIGKTFSDANIAKESAEKQTPTEFIEKNWGPKGKR